MVNKETLLTLKEKALGSPIYGSPLFPPSPYYRFLRVLAEYLESALSVELGVSGGGGSLHLGLGNPSGIVLGVDISDIYPQENYRHIVNTVENFFFVKGDSVNCAEYIFELWGKPDIIFFDTVHTEEQVLEEVKVYTSLLDGHKSVLCFDDLWREEMLKFWEKIPEPKVRMDELHPGSTEGGFGVWLCNYKDV